ncbi:MAG: HAMP domain-containing protein [Turneriella sp.]|nr:HAMP domain-containing protein [Turneriella sp.]
MEIFGVPVYLNLLSVGCFLPVLLGIVAGSYTLSIKNKSANTVDFALMLLVLATFLFAYAGAMAIFDPVGRFHRWLTVSIVLLMLSLYFRFIMTYSENTHGQIIQIIFRVKLFFVPVISYWFITKSEQMPFLFRRSGQFWDFDMPIQSLVVSGAILVYAIISLFFIVSKFRRMQNRRNARTFLFICAIINSYLLVGAILNPLSRKEIISTDFFIWVQAIGATLGFFGIFVVFLSHTQERSTVAGNLIGITLVATLILIPLLAYPLIEDRKASFREIWAAKLQAENKALADKNIVFLFSAENSGTYFRDNPNYYRNALKNSPADGVILRADASGGVYTFPVMMPAPAEFTRKTGKPGGSTLNPTTYLAGIELTELRKYIHPTAAKLLLAQFVVILVIVSLFPLFFRGILLSPMRRLLDGVIAISRGRYGHRIENFRSDELGVISRHFDKMAITIEASTTKLEETVAQRTAQLTEEKKKSDTLLLNILPERIADELKEKGHTQPMRIESATVLFTDFVGFTKISENLSPEEVVAELDKCFSYFDQVTEKYRLEKLKTIGDSFMCAGGLPTPNKTHAIDACLAALEIQAFMNQMKEIKHQQGFPYWELRLGINTGPLVAGVVGHKKFAYDVWGDTVNTASRMESSGLAGEINISHSTYDLVQKWFVCEHRGRVSAKNKGEIDMYLLKCIRAEYCIDADGRVPSERMKREYVSVRIGKLL